MRRSPCPSSLLIAEIAALYRIKRRMRGYGDRRIDFARRRADIHLRNHHSLIRARIDNLSIDDQGVMTGTVSYDYMAKYIDINFVVQEKQK